VKVDLVLDDHYLKQITQILCQTINLKQTGVKLTICISCWG